MSSNLRGATILFDEGTPVDDTGATSQAGYPGPMTNVGIMIQNEGADAVTCTVQVAGGPPAAGRNPDLSTADWFDLYDENDGSLITLAIPGGSKRAFDLSPFVFPYVRIHAVAGAGDSTTVHAVMVANG